MRHTKAVEHINTLSFQPESGRWVAITESTYRSGRKTKRKLLVITLLMAVFLSLYNPMKSFKPQATQTDTIDLSVAKVETNTYTMAERS